MYVIPQNSRRSLLVEHGTVTTTDTHLYSTMPHAHEINYYYYSYRNRVGWNSLSRELLFLNF
jgi:hypothetical protein